MNVLLVEDDTRISDILVQAMSEEGHHVSALSSGEEVEAYLSTNSFEIVVLDLMLPGISGLGILKRLREARYAVPVMILSARDTMADVVKGLDCGADDYLTKPFHLDNFLARMRAVARRGSIAQPHTLEYQGIRLDAARREASRDGRRIDLTAREYALLKCLMKRANQVVTREKLIDAGWGVIASGNVSGNNLEFYMHRLRGKIDIQGEPSLIRTVRAVGYLLGQ